LSTIKKKIETFIFLFFLGKNIITIKIKKKTKKNSYIKNIGFGPIRTTQRIFT